jgi:NTP pyrophosphatase (non-canonical NTP hydrolase)
MKTERVEVSAEAIKESLKLLEEMINKRLEKHGKGTFVSNHEILGIITEEYYELIEAVNSNVTKYVRSELMDLAVGCIFGEACYKNIYNLREKEAIEKIKNT